jgi:Flp pilus assembly protein CpaB
MSYILSRIYASHLTGLQTTYIAAADIPPRTCISEADLVEVEIPGKYIIPYALNEKEKIIGRYTDIQGMIPAGSPFYESMVKDEEDLPDHPVLQLKKGQTAFTMETDMAKLGSIIAGQRVDIHVSIAERDQAPVSGVLVENARVIAIRDHKGLDVNDPEGTGIPYFTEVAVDRKDLEWLTLAQSFGELRLFTSDDPYDTSQEGKLAEDSPVLAYLQGKLKQQREEKKTVQNEKEG